MKFLLALTTLIAATASAAQTIAIGAPLERTSISPGSSMTVEVDRPVRSLSLFLDLGLTSRIAELFDRLTRNSHRHCPLQLRFARGMCQLRRDTNPWFRPLLRSLCPCIPNSTWRRLEAAIPELYRPSS